MKLFMKSPYIFILIQTIFGLRGPKFCWELFSWLNITKLFKSKNSACGIYSSDNMKISTKIFSVFESHPITLPTKDIILKCISVWLYGIKSCILTETTTKKLTAFEMWLLKILWVYNISNHEVLRKMKKLSEIITTINTKREYLCHIIGKERRWDILKKLSKTRLYGNVVNP